jgi:hypothetical protein
VKRIEAIIVNEQLLKDITKMNNQAIRLGLNVQKDLSHLSIYRKYLRLLDEYGKASHVYEELERITNHKKSSLKVIISKLNTEV